MCYNTELAEDMDKLKESGTVTFQSYLEMLVKLQGKDVKKKDRDR